MVCLRHVRGSDRKVYIVSGDGHLHAMGTTLKKTQPDGRVTPTEVLHDGCDDDRACSGVASYAHVTLHLLSEPVHSIGPGAQLAHHGAHPGKQELAGQRQSGSPRGPHEQVFAQRTFQGGDVRADPRLGSMRGAGGSGEASVLRHG